MVLPSTPLISRELGYATIQGDRVERRNLMALRILVVEDDLVIGILLGEMLEAMGHIVCAITATEIDAVVAAALHRPGLMIVDAQLGEGSGIHAVDQILLAGPVPHLFTSGDTLRARKLKPDAVMIQKPFKEAELSRAIERALAPASSITL